MSFPLSYLLSLRNLLTILTAWIKQRKWQVHVKLIRKILDEYLKKVQKNEFSCYMYIVRKQTDSTVFEYKEKT